MPRPTKAIRRLKINAGIAFLRGEKKEAYDLWTKAAKATAEYQAKKKKNQKGKPAAAPSAEGAA